MVIWLCHHHHHLRRLRFGYRYFLIWFRVQPSQCEAWVSRAQKNKASASPSIHLSFLFHSLAGLLLSFLPSSLDIMSRVGPTHSTCTRRFVWQLASKQASPGSISAFNFSLVLTRNAKKYGAQQCLVFWSGCSSLSFSWSVRLVLQPLRHCPSPSLSLSYLPNKIESPNNGSRYLANKHQRVFQVGRRKTRSSFHFVSLQILVI